jgi:hypothetical protein
VTFAGNPIDVRHVPPIGSLDVVAARSAGAVRVAGWAIDPDTAVPIAVRFHLDGILWAGIGVDDETEAEALLGCKTIVA